MSAPPFESFGAAVRRRRLALGLNQGRLADRLGMSRQNLAEIEAGRRLPHLSMAKRLAEALGWSLDEMTRALPGLAGEPAWQWVLDAPPSQPTPVVWTLIADRLALAQAGRLAPEFIADGVWDPARGTVAEAAGARDPASTLFVAGCDPLLAWIWQRTPHPDLTLYVFSMGSESALRALSDGMVHIAGTHLFDPATGQYNAILRTMPFPVMRWQYLQWEAGMMGALKSPDGWALRETGSEARALFDRYRPPSDPRPPIVELDSHWGIARYVRAHPEVAGVGIRAVAAALDLPFTQWSREKFEWVTRAEWVPDARIRSFVHWLGSPAVAAILEQVPGVGPWDPGQATISD